MTYTCATCGNEHWELFGAERMDHYLETGKTELAWMHADRVPGAGLFVSEEERAGADIFRIREFPGWMFCLDVVRDMIVSSGFSNVAFREMGETF
jgi:hypothetical protein